MITGRELIECVRGMTAEERRELAALLFVNLSKAPVSSFLRRGISGYQDYQEAMASLTPEQRKELVRISYTGT